jgi:hypothetical protein
VPPPFVDLSGHYLLHPGQPHSVVGQRPVLGGGRLGRLLRGQQGTSVERTLGHIFNLCAHAHRRVSRSAFRAANPETTAAHKEDALVFLRLETARDHLRSMALDWPQRQGSARQSPAALSWLNDCPVPLATDLRLGQEQDAWDLLARLRDWLGDSVLRQAVPDWLAEHGAPDVFARWCAVHAGRLAPIQCLETWRPQAQTLTPSGHFVDILDANAAQQNMNLQQVAHAIAHDPDFVQRPSWRGQCAETGAWARLRHCNPSRIMQVSAWTRLSSRWLELMELVSAPALMSGDHHDPLLSSGALALDSGQAIAWCEMARGMLLHWVQLDALGCVADYRVLAPTEWNFHPEGTLAGALTALPRHDGVSAEILSAAFDPCVDCTVLPESMGENSRA